MKWNKNDKNPAENNLFAVGLFIMGLFFVLEDKEFLNDEVSDEEEYLNRNIGDDVMYAENFVQKRHQRHFGENDTTCQDNIADKGRGFVGVGFEDKDTVDEVVDG